MRLFTSFSKVVLSASVFIVAGISAVSSAFAAPADLLSNQNTNVKINTELTNFGSTNATKGSTALKNVGTLNENTIGVGQTQTPSSINLVNPQNTSVSIDGKTRVSSDLNSNKGSTSKVLVGNGQSTIIGSEQSNGSLLNVGSPQNSSTSIKSNVDVSGNVNSNRGSTAIKVVDVTGKTVGIIKQSSTNPVNLGSSQNANLESSSSTKVTGDVNADKGSSSTSATGTTTDTSVTIIQKK
jgi:hypothetical protein